MVHCDWGADASLTIHAKVWMGEWVPEYFGRHGLDGDLLSILPLITECSALHIIFSISHLFSIGKEILVQTQLKAISFGEVLKSGKSPAVQFPVDFDIFQNTDGRWSSCISHSLLLLLLQNTPLSAVLYHSLLVIWDQFPSALKPIIIAWQLWSSATPWQ